MATKAICDRCGGNTTKPTEVGSENLCKACTTFFADTCGVCGKVHLKEDMRYVTIDGERKAVCKTCLESYKKCSCCGTYTTELHDTSDGGVCSKCRENYSECAHCRTTVLTSSLDDHGECSVCQSLPRCHDCGSRIEDGEHVTYHENIICLSCYAERYQRCEDCGSIHLIDEIRFYPQVEQYRCHTCRPGVQLSGYSFKPNPIYFGSEDKSSLFMGIELEVDYKDKTREALSALNDELGEHCYYKSDGSLRNGFEIVTHPMTLDYIKDMPFAKAFSTLTKMGYKSHDTDTCGLHVHVSKRFFGSNQDEQDLGIMKVIYFYEKFWSQIVKFSRRKPDAISRWAARYTMKRTMQDLLSTAKGAGGRYFAVNLQPRHTVEFRIFKGTLKYSTFMATVQLTHEICRICKDISPEDLQALTWAGFVELINKDACTELMTYLSSKGLMASTEVITFENDTYREGDPTPDSDEDDDDDDYDEDDDN